MKKPVTKIICATLASVVALGITATAGCSPYNKGTQLGGEGIFTRDKAVSNGGFAVEKGDYVYFINGVTSNTVDNTFGKPDKGTIKRIATADLNARNYSDVQTVVPQIAYSANYNSGIFVYGDYVYYSTPSTARNSDGVIQSSNLDLKSTKLDGTESMKDAYVTFPSLSYDFRFVEVEDVVYILYVATSETIFDEASGVTNLHSYNTSTRKDTLLAYNISSYLFDAEDKTNPNVYYTMNVRSFATGATEKYNQVYTVSAEADKENEYDTSSLVWWDDETDRYINCGKLVFDGIGTSIATATPFNYKPDGSELNDYNFTYTLETYRQGSLFYTRHTNSNSTEYLYSLKESALTSEWNPVKDNPEQGKDHILNNGSNADSYAYLFKDNGDLEAVLNAESGGGISINYVDENGKLSANINNKNYYRIVREGTATILNVDTENKYLYYSVSGGNGYTFNRIKYTGNWSDYDGMFENDDVSDFTPVRILDLDAASGWYRPEFIEGNILFASETDNMTSYNYIMAFDLYGEDGKLMTNADIDALNKQFEGVIGSEGIIADYVDTDKYDSAIYANLANAAKYMFYTSDLDYVKELAEACNAELGKNDDPVYSETTLNKLADFIKPTQDNDWAGYTATRKVNGEDVYANRRDYYYSVVGNMTSEDAEALRDSFRSEYLKSWPEVEEVSWWDGLSTVARVFFIIGMCLAGILFIAAVALVTAYFVRKSRSSKMPGYSKRRIKVDTTDDKNIDVYSDGNNEDSAE